MVDVTNVVNRVLATIIQVLLSTGGDVLHFAGDAILALWQASSSTAETQELVTAAVRSCVRIQRSMARDGHLVQVKLGA